MPAATIKFYACFAVFAAATALPDYYFILSRIIAFESAVFSVHCGGLGVFAETTENCDLLRGISMD